jgi:hypothetical protein
MATQGRPATAARDRDAVVEEVLPHIELCDTEAFMNGILAPDNSTLLNPFWKA